ncbi:MAG: hypothetical protein ABIJ61_02010 [bacterium]
MAICLVLLLSCLLATACSETEPQAEPTTVADNLDSLLGSLVPVQKHKASRYLEWLADQKAAIRTQALDPELVMSVIKWYRTEISDAAEIEGYTIYPVVERWETRIKLDSLVPLTVTELNKQPTWAQPVMYHPQRHTGVAFRSGLLENLTAAIRLDGDRISSPEQFRELCLGFLEMAFRDAQIIITDSLEWGLYRVADSLANRNPGTPAATRLAQALVDRVMAMESVEFLDTLPEAVALRQYLDREEPDWFERLPVARFRSSMPSLRRGVYRWQVHVMDAYSMQTRASIFYFDEARGFWLQDVEMFPPVRSRIQLG